MRNYAVEGLDLAVHIRKRVLGKSSEIDLCALEEICVQEARQAAIGRRKAAVDWESEIQALLVAALNSDVLSWPQRHPCPRCLCAPGKEEHRCGGPDWGVVSVHHSPMGGARSQREGAELRRNGARAGWPDLDIRFVDVEGRRRCVLLELKAPGGQLSKSQKETQYRLLSAGFEAHVSKGLAEAVSVCIKMIHCAASGVDRA